MANIGGDSGSWPWCSCRNSFLSHSLSWQGEKTFKQRYLVQGVHRWKRSICNTGKVSRYSKILACSIYIFSYLNINILCIFMYIFIHEILKIMPYRIGSMKVYQAINWF